jgi:hypothetical protein
MGCTVRELLARIDSRELSEWQVYHKLDPWDEKRSDLRAGIIASTVANCLNEKSWKPSDFMPKYGPPPEPEVKTVEQLKDAAIRIAAMFGGAMRK